MDVGVIIAISGATVAIVGVMATLFLWVRGEASADRKHFLDVQTADRREFIGIVRSIESSICEMKIENKDFHHRLLEIERSRTK